MNKRVFEKLIITVIFLLITVGCSKDLKVNTKYDSIKLEVSNVLNAGCHEVDNDTYFTHNMQDKHIYGLDYENNMESIKTDNWVGYNTDETQYVSSDLGVTFTASDELSDKIFETNYRESLIKLLEYIETSDKTDITRKNSVTTFVSHFDDEEKVFEIVKKFGTVNAAEELKEMEVLVTMDSNNNVIKIIFNLTSSLAEHDVDSCYVVTWNLSNFNEAKVILPNFDN